MLPSLKRKTRKRGRHWSNYVFVLSTVCLAGTAGAWVYLLVMNPVFLDSINQVLMIAFILLLFVRNLTKPIVIPDEMNRKQAETFVSDKVIEKRSLLENLRRDYTLWLLIAGAIDFAILAWI